MELLEKIELFYKMAQQLENGEEISEEESNPPINTAILDRIAKLNSLAKHSKSK